jgi:DNA-binding CsgD family transcriptional regulator
MGSIAEMMTGEPTSARRMLDEAEVTAAAQADPAGPISVLQARALNAFMEADLDTVRSAASEGILLAREAGDLYSLEMMLLNLGSAALLAGDLGGSKPLLAESLRIADQMDDRVARFYLLDAFGCHAALSGQPRLAAQLLGAADTVRTEAGANTMPFLASLVTHAQESAATALGAARFTAGFEAGKRMDWDTALALALGKPAQAPVAVHGHAGPGPLGQREAEVARLVADGLTNKQIGTRLFISERTVDSHVRSILNKLGFSSRAQIAAWIASPGQ